MKRALVVPLFAALVVLACSRAKAPPAPAPSAEVTSNVTRADYAGSAACATCHAELYDRWMSTPMHGMTREISKAKVHAPFDGTIFHFKQDRLTLETKDGHRFMALSHGGESAEKPGVQLFRVTKVIGGRHREDFAGVEVGSYDQIPKESAEEKILPVSFQIASKTFRYKGYSVMEKERPGLRAAGAWRSRCIFCHNTEPYLDVMLGALSESAKPYQGVMVDRLLPPDRRATFTVTDEDAFRDALHDEIRRLDANDAVQVARAKDRGTAVERATTSIRNRFDERNLLEVGIGCEACHGGAKQHVDDPRVKPSFTPKAPWLSVTAPKGTDAHAQAENRVCARCHQVLFSGYFPTWENGLRTKSAGGSHINSGEARDFLLGGCASKMACSSCHDPHEPNGSAKLGALVGPKGNAICTKCHDRYATPEAHAKHAHHDPQGAGGACIACHMPAKNMGLEGRLVRYHRIGSPNDVTRVEGDRPLECALCHTSGTAKSLVESMETWWGKTYDRAALKALYGDLDASPILATLSVGKPHEQAVAIALAGDAKLRPAVPFIVPHATHPIPLLRYWAVDALSKILGVPSPIELHRENAEIDAKVRAWVQANGVALAK